MKKVFAVIIGAFMLIVGASGCANAMQAEEPVDIRQALTHNISSAVSESVAAQDVSVSEKHIKLQVGESKTLTATVMPQGAEKAVEWVSANTNIATVSAAGEVKAVSEGSTTVTASIANGERAVCQVKVSRAVSDDGLEMQEDGYLYYEDFTRRSQVPSYFDQDVTGVSRAAIEDGALRMTVINGKTSDHAFLTYKFDEPLDSGRYVVEARVCSDSLSFANFLFFFSETSDFSDSSKVMTNIAMEGGWFKNNSGTGWTDSAISYLLEYETGAWYDIKMAMDLDEGYYNLTVGDNYSLFAPFRKAVTDENSAIRYLRIGSESAWADVSYEYIRMREATEEDFVDNTVDYTQDFEGTEQPSDLVSDVSGGGKLDFSTEGQVTLSTQTSGTVSLYKQFDATLSGVVATEVRFRNESSISNTFANILFLKNSRQSGTSANIVTIAVEGGYLRYHNGSKWTSVQYNGNPIYLIDDAWYTVKAINDYSAKTTKLYLSGEYYKTDASGEQIVLGTDIYLGEFGFRNANIGNPDVFELAIGTGKSQTQFTVDYVKIYSVQE